MMRSGVSNAESGFCIGVASVVACPSVNGGFRLLGLRSGVEEPLMRGFETAQLAPDFPAQDGVMGKARPMCTLDRKHDTIYPYTLYGVNRFVRWRGKSFKIDAMKTKQVRAGLDKRALVVRLRRIKGQIEGIEKMVEGDADTPDLLMQVVSARQALKSFSEEVIEAHLHECIEGTAVHAEGRREIRALLEVLKRYAS